MRASDFASEDEYLDAVYDANADRIEDARREEAEDAFDEVAVTCGSCGERYDPGLRAATRFDPAWQERDTCPRCGSDAVEGEL